MSETPSHNFLTDIINKDLKDGTYQYPFTRFPPEPSGYLHIGHVKSICINFGIKEDYQGKCNLRFDDTNPANEDEDYVQSIQEDIKWLGFEWDGEIKYASQYFEQLYKYAQDLIKQGFAYVDFSSPEQIKEMRGDYKTPGTNSIYRDQSPEEALEHFADMRNGKYQEGDACLRAKIDMASPFIVMRDPVIYRIKHAKHHQTGHAWKIYPMYDFAHCISDAIENITHSLCTLEFQDNRRLYDWILSKLEVGGTPHQYEFSRLNIEGSFTSKRKITKLVEQGVVDGWDDPRLATIAGLRRRGYTPAALREFCKRIGVTKQDALIEKSALESCIRDDLNTIAYRAMVVRDPIKLVITNFNAPEALSFANHPNDESYGRREIIFTKEIFIEREDFQEVAEQDFKRLTLGGEVRLRHSYIIKAESVEKDNQGNITQINASYDPATLGKKPEGRKVKGVIHWVSAEHAIEVNLNIYTDLFTIENPSEVPNFIDFIDYKSKHVVKAMAEPSLIESRMDQSFQFERIGYFKRDSRTFDNGVLDFNLTVSLKEGY